MFRAELTVSKDFKFGETNKSAEFLKIFPLGKVPAFEGSDGTLLTESNAIAYNVANEKLRGGSDAAARSQVCCASFSLGVCFHVAACKGGAMQCNRNCQHFYSKTTLPGIWVWKGQELVFDLCEDWW